MTVYNYGQLEQLWINAGGSRALAPVMAAIALAESSGNSNAMNYTDNGGTQTSVGLWQVSSGTHSYPSSWTTPAGNAAEAVAKLASQGLSAWGTYTSGAYKQFLQGSVPPSPVPGGGGGGGGGGSGGGGGGGGPSGAALAGGYESDIQPITADIQTASFLGDVFTTVLDPFKEILGAEKDIASFFSQPFVGVLDVFKTLVTGVNALIGGLKTIIHDVLWLFNPSHWVRIFCFIFGLFVAIPAVYALMHTGTGDMYLAMGIALTTLAGALFFLAFHNLPFDPTPGAPASSKNVISFQALLAYISEGIRTGVAPSGINLDALYTLDGQGGGGGSGGGGGPVGTFLTSAVNPAPSTGSFSPDSGSSGSPSGGGGTFTPVGNATGIFPTLTPGGIIPAGGALPGGTGGPITGRTYPSGF